MKPETAAYLRKSREFIDKAAGMLAEGWADEAGRAAYLSGYHAAQALIFQSTDRAAKTHSGVQSEFARLVRHLPAFDVGLRRFLGRAYSLKAVADYEIGHGSPVTDAQALEAIAMARQFLAAVTATVTAGSG